METEKAIRNGLALLTLSLRQEVDSVQVRAYLRGLRDIQADIITDGADRLIRDLATVPAGKRYFPTVPDWIAACADIVDERRQAVARQAKALQADCPECHGTGWANTEGPNAVVRCRCHQRAQEVMASVVAPIRRPALPAHEPDATT